MRSPRALFRRQSLRVRITISFLTGVVALTLVLAMVTFLTVRAVLERSRFSSSTRQTVFALLFAREFVSANPDEVERLVSLLQTREKFDALVTTDDGWYSTALSLTPSSIPSGLSALVGRERLGYQYAEVGDAHTLVFGAPLPPAKTDLYLFYPLEDIDHTMGLLARVLGIGGLAVVVASVALAQRMSARILRPLVGVSSAAHRVAEGLLETRVQASSSDELGTLAASFNQMAAALQEMIHRERRFVAAVSHELRTPLAALHATGELLAARRGELSPPAREAVDLILEDVTGLRRLVEELMEVSELDSPGASVRWEKVSLSSVATAVMRRRHLNIPADGPDVIAFTDKARLERILGNLIDNAMEHGRGQDVRLSLRPIDGECLVTVSDKGPGIPPQDLPHLFERFYKVDRSRSREGGGIGLGLAIAMQNAQLLGGTIEATSEFGQGSTFVVRLPRHDTPPEEDE